MEFLEKISHRVKEYWNGRDKSHKIKLIISIFVAISGLVTILYMVGSPKYIPLYSELDLKEAGEIAAKLDEMGVNYKIEDEGKTILVDSKQLYKTRLMLAQEGLPKGGSIGFEDVFSKMRLGTTDWERRIQYNQALQGELEKSIEKMESVESARVYIVQQEDTLFIEPNSNYEPSAAVFLEVKPGYEMSKEEVMGIINLITYSVKNLKSENVTIVDQFGRTLSDLQLSEEAKSQDLIENQLIIQNNFQKQLQSNVQSLLEQIFGPGNVAVRVNAKLNFDQKTIQNTLFKPVNEETGEGIVRSIQELKEHFSGSGYSPGGVPGVDSNIPGYAQIQTGDSEHERTEVIKNYEINETRENLTIAPGAVEKLTVSVVINRQLTDEEEESIALVVGNAIGWVPERDQISIKGMEFENDIAELFAEQLSKQQQEKQRQRLIQLIGVGLALLLLFIIIRTILNQRRAKLEKERLSEEMLVMQQAAAAKEQEETRMEEDSIYNKITKLARRKPDDVAKVLKTWLSEDQR